MTSSQALPVSDSVGSRPSQAAAETISLDRLAPNVEAVVESVEGDPLSRRRLLEAGFVAGSRVRFLMATPFGDPLVFSLRGTSIALRRSDARHVRVRA